MFIRTCFMLHVSPDVFVHLSPLFSSCRINIRLAIFTVTGRISLAARIKGPLNLRTDKYRLASRSPKSWSVVRSEESPETPESRHRGPKAHKTGTNHPLPASECKPAGAFLKPWVCGFDGLQTRVPGYPV